MHDWKIHNVVSVAQLEPDPGICTKCRCCQQLGTSPDPGGIRDTGFALVVSEMNYESSTLGWERTSFFGNELAIGYFTLPSRVRRNMSVQMDSAIYLLKHEDSL